MKISTAIPLLLALPLAACGWFQPPAQTLEPEGGYEPVAVDQRPLVAEVTQLTLEPTTTGLIVRADGLPPFQGYWNVALVEQEGSPAGTKVYEFRLREPVAPVQRSTAQSRRVEAGAYLTAAELRGVSRITVIAATNSLSRSR